MDETQNDAPFVAFYDMHAVTFVPPDEMADVTIAGLQWFILIPPIKPHGVIEMQTALALPTAVGDFLCYKVSFLASFQRERSCLRNQHFFLLPRCFLLIQ